MAFHPDIGRGRCRVRTGMPSGQCSNRRSTAAAQLAPSRPGGQALLAHQARGGVLAHPPSQLAQVGSDPRRPVGALVSPEQAPDLGCNAARRAARGVSVPFFHLQDQDRDTPSARQAVARGILRSSLWVAIGAATATAPSRP